MKPMLATSVEVAQVRFPVYVSAKLDGVRGLVIDGQLRSRSLKTFPNAHVQATFSIRELSGLDGELIYGEPTAKDAFRATTSATANSAGKPRVAFYVFDDFTCKGGFANRLLSVNRKAAFARRAGIRVEVLEQRLIKNAKALLAFETEMLETGYEGLILRSPASPYKRGRSTVNEGWMLKLKRFSDSEAVILAVEEEMANTNVAVRNALGNSERSGAQAGMVRKGTMGSLQVRDVKSGIVFNIGSGFNAADRRLFWTERHRVLGMTVKYKSFLIGVKDAPRFPVYLGMRPQHDMGE